MNWLWHPGGLARNVSAGRSSSTVNGIDLNLLPTMCTLDLLDNTSTVKLIYSTQKACIKNDSSKKTTDFFFL